MTTVYSNNESVFEALKAGANGYLLEEQLVGGGDSVDRRGDGGRGPDDRPDCPARYRSVSRAPTPRYGGERN